MTGSIACYKACNTISKLVQSGFDVQVVASPAALQFVGSATMEGLTGRPVLSDLWASGQAMDHIHLVRSADLILMAPATANTINKMAHGVGDDLITTLFLAHDFKKPFLLAPAMNTAMYLHPITQSSISRLREIGIEILETASGVLACGEVGYGKLLDPELIFAEVTRALGSTPQVKLEKAKSKNLKVLITAGGTQEPIDDVRVLTNRSTGATGAKLAERLYDYGLDVTLLHATSAVKPQRDLTMKSFETFADLADSLESSLKNQKYDVVIHAAAVSDFSVENSLLGGKLKSDAGFDLKLKKNPKLINQIKTWSPGVNLVAFKMTSTEDLKSRSQDVSKLFTETQADVVVHNDVREINWKTGKHSFGLYLKPEQEKKLEIENVDQLADVLFEKVFMAKELT